MVTIPMVYENKNIGKCLRCIMQSHDRTPHQGMGQTPISWTRVFQTSSQEVFHMEPMDYKFKEVFS